jgi:hypothetical protein
VQVSAEAICVEVGLAANITNVPIRKRSRESRRPCLRKQYAAQADLVANSFLQSRQPCTVGAPLPAEHAPLWIGKSATRSISKKVRCPYVNLNLNCQLHQQLLACFLQQAFPNSRLVDSKASPKGRICSWARPGNCRVNQGMPPNQIFLDTAMPTTFKSNESPQSIRPISQNTAIVGKSAKSQDVPWTWISNVSTNLASVQQ